MHLMVAFNAFNHISQKLDLIIINTDNDTLIITKLDTT